MPSREVIRKAAGMVAEGKVREVTIARTFYVTGETRQYVVTVFMGGSGPSNAVCNCEWGHREVNGEVTGACSHALAGMLMAQATD